MADTTGDDDTAVPVTYRVDGRVATVTLNRPRYRNAQSRLLLDELDAAFDRAVADDEVRVIVLRGAGPHFSSGHDIGTPEELADREARPWPPGWLGDQRRSWELNVANTLRWRDLPKPTIAAVHGLCIYGAWMVASAMDVIVAADDARFLPAHFQYFSVPWDLGARQTKELLWLGEFVDAEQAHELGFVNHVVPAAELESFVADLAGRVSRLDPFVASMIKRSVNEMQDHQGFRTAITAAHATYVQIQAAGLVMPAGQEGTIRRLPSVERSLRDDPVSATGDGPGEPTVSAPTTTSDIDRFLAARVRLATLTTLRADGSPVSVPVWFDWDGEQLTMFCGSTSAKLTRIEHDPRVTVTVSNDVDELEGWVAFDGEARIESTGGLALAERLAPRYWDVGDADRRTSLEAWRAAGDDAFRLVAMTPSRIRTG
ncbi:MAG: enoyl-CoA hydratase-related protein [Actinomycetota bacterium]